jgi:hypothetical protein
LARRFSSVKSEDGILKLTQAAKLEEARTASFSGDAKKEDIENISGQGTPSGAILQLILQAYFISRYTHELQLIACF